MNTSAKTTFLSICIPVYNEDIKILINQLVYQLKTIELPVEIICLDDDSRPDIKEKNRAYLQNKNVIYHELDQNVGRAKIRNRLADMAQGEWLLYLDNDSVIEKDDYIKTYLNQDLNQEIVYYGGTEYASKVPTEQNLLLHWYYGVMRESLTPEERQMDPYSHFHSNNFMIPRQLILQLPFEEFLFDYGYEDLVLAHRLKSHQIPIIHIFNPVRHDGLVPFEAYVERSKSATQNLKGLYDAGFIDETKLIRAAQKLKFVNEIGIFKMSKHKLESALISYLHRHPNHLRIYDALRVLWYLA